MQPGAVPQALGRMRAPLANIACLRLFSGQLPRRLRIRACMASQLASSNSMGRPSSSAAISFVRSSCVGPRPPVVITRSLRDSASESASRIRPGLSPTVWCQSTLMPRACSSRERICASPLAICPMSSSVPTAISSAFTGRPPEPRGSSRRIPPWNRAS